MASLDYSGTVPTGVRVAQVLGLTTSAWLSGSISAFSWVGVQALLNAKTPADHSAKIWHEMYEIGAGLAPFIAIVPAVSFGYLAYDARTASSLRLGSFRDTAFYLYSFAAVIIPAIAPFTMTVMIKTNDTLHAKARAGFRVDSEVEPLLKKWYGLNFVRSIMVATGTLAGAWAAFGGLS